jgi:cell division protein FtsW
MRSEAAMPAPRLRLVRPGEVSPAVARARAERSGRRILLTLTVCVAALTLTGLVMVLSASSVSAFAQYGSSFLFFKRQVIYALAGGVVAFGTARMRYQVWRRAWMPLLVVTIGLLVLVLQPSTGTSAGGSARWIALGSLSIQPSELAKFTLVATTAAILARRMRYIHDPIVWLLPLVPVIGGVFLLILLQPDLGTAMVLLATVFLLLFVAGVRLRLLATSLFLSLGAGMILILSAGYRRTRFLAYLHPWADPRNTGYQIVQSLIALGSGHLFGVGLGASRQAWMYLPNAHTDFIFAILGEELGLAGELMVLGLFAAIIYAGIRIALRAPDSFGRLLAAGITGWLGLQALVNLGAVTGMLPITGVPLPFISFGGSSLVVSLAGIGVLLSIGRAGLPSARGSERGTGRRTGRRKRDAAPSSRRSE